jgi:hypothetical protein
MTNRNITFLDQFIDHGIFTINNPKFLILSDYNKLDIKKFLNTLDIDKTYVLSIEYIYSWLLYDDEYPSIILSKPIVVTKFSNPKLISEFIIERIHLIFERYYLDDSFITQIGKDDGPGIIIKYQESILFDNPF